MLPEMPLSLLLSHRVDSEADDGFDMTIVVPHFLLHYGLSTSTIKTYECPPLKMQAEVCLPNLDVTSIIIYILI